VNAARSSTLSVCCLAADPPGRVAAVLATLRSIADEVVVAVDANAGEGAGALGAIADRVYRVPVELPLEQYLPWLHSLCSGEWVFRIDGDEVPSTALLEVLGALPGADNVLQYRLPRRWLFGGPDRWLAEDPWMPDYQIRIYRNDPRTLRFRGTVHSTAEAVLPARYLEAPIYHLALLVTTAEERERRVRRYEALPAAGPIDNAVVYLPEHLDAPQTAETPQEDIDLIRRALAGRATTPSEAEVIDVALTDALRLSPLRVLTAQAYDVEIEVLAPDLRLTSGTVVEVPVRLRNRGTERFPWGDWSPPVRLSYHWLDVSGEPVVFDGGRTLLPADLMPGGEAVVPARVSSSGLRQGAYILEVDLVHEGVRWFGRGARVPVTIAPGTRPRRWWRR
jgi:hypothetical protein